MDQRAYHRYVVKTMGTIEKDLSRRPFNCLYPGCHEKAIKSHSQHKSGQLRAIAENGLVYAGNFNLYSLYDPKRTHVVELVETPIANASTFPGYCGGHDSTLFSPIEKRALVQGDKEQALLLFLRAFSLEFAAKRGALIKQKRLMEAVAPHVEPRRIEAGKASMAGIQLFVDREGPYYFLKLFQLIQENRFDEIGIQWIVVPQNLLASSSCCINPLLDDYENHFDARSPVPQSLVAFSLVPTPVETHVIACWLNEHAEQASWIAQGLSTETELERTINLLAVSESEDTCFNPKLWNALPGKTKEEALEAMRHSLYRKPLADIPIVIRLTSKAKAKTALY